MLIVDRVPPPFCFVLGVVPRRCCDWYAQHGQQQRGGQGHGQGHDRRV